MPRALIVGSSSGIGLAIARRLIAEGWDVVGVARRPLEMEGYRHIVGDVRNPDIGGLLAPHAQGLDLCVYASGVGRVVDLDTFAGEVDQLDTNLLGVARVVEAVLPAMTAAGRGHFIGVSSQADRLIDRHAPGYSASKAGMSRYLEGLALACRRRGVAITSLRLGIVDTPMSADMHPRPFLVTPERVAALVMRVIRRRPIRVTFPKRMAPLVWLVNLGARWRIFWT